MSKSAENAARVRKLENAAPPPEQAVTVYWSNPGDEKLEPGTLVIKWEQDGSISTHRVKPARARG